MTNLIGTQAKEAHQSLFNHTVMARFLTILLAAFLLSLHSKASAQDVKEKHYFMYFSNPIEGEEDSFVNWYKGQHMHDLLNIEGLTAAQLFKLSDNQYKGAPEQHYMMIWELDTNDPVAVFARIRAGLKSGKTVLNGTMDGSSTDSKTYTPITNRLTQEEIEGLSPKEVGELASEGLN